ncbi:HNH endonuclease signature motif containing protein [Mycobacteroides franklinii]|uniref:HNH nuclease domain-containing protein n=1 Tax=Mycobacteroides franklinii TaxID=948102 RepID=A0A4R8QTJ5_9MYCO|nr:HNH endonuclease signature motif containing protein [Mycobacteroides franklinii]TDZ44429.1 hypothetical protein CCUG64054_04494 [Mycobacteroides franklinii]TDZ47316.1 hypothetical protein CCUG63697_04747 [Mycobacteroides franklinii]TDZ57982.1 hypothetical protein CCUG63696_04489 [Mycobacteroides franklinii]TDZ64924.1 hypothetical protein CCUG63695_04420 [Mycobacteroides franklinii]TDZ71322.1 hypothetical protein CCUG64056_04494 [Mycobacteroides franklinii]
MFDTLPDADLIDVITSAQRAEAQACAQKLSAIGLLVDRRADLGKPDERDRHPLDRWDRVAAEIGAAQGITQALASSQMRHAQVLRHRLRAVAERFATGDLDFRTVALIVNRTELLDDDAVVALVDAAIVQALPRWTRWSQRRLTAALDALVLRFDQDAVRRNKSASEGRHIEIRPLGNGEPVAEIWGTLQATHAVALDKRLDLLAASVCPADPRTKAQRRADAVGALTRGLDQMRCTCGHPDCTGRDVADVSVVVNVVLNQSTLDGRDDLPAYLPGFGVLAAEQARTATTGARTRTLSDSRSTGYRPSPGLAAFVRSRDQLCRFPGCEAVAEQADIDHTVPWTTAGRTTSINLKALCRKHHLLKTFGGWTEIQESDGTVVWKAPTGHTYATTPASRFLFPALTRPRTRKQERDQRRRAERNLNRQTRLQREAALATLAAKDPPPF